jgi:hypothetical protein
VQPGFLDISSTAGATVKVDHVTWGNIGPDGKAQVQVPPKDTYLIEIQAPNADPFKKTVGPVSADQHLIVSAKLTFHAVAPTVDSFTGPNEPVSQGQTIRLTWKTTNAKSVDIDGLGQNLNPNDSREVPVTQNATYTLVARGDGGISPASTVKVVLKVVAPPKAPTVATFAASSASIKQGDSVTLTWSTNDAQSVSIDNGVGQNLPPSGTRPVSPSQTTTYKLTATGPGGNASASAPVTVEAKTEPKPPEPKPPVTPPSSDQMPAIRATLDQLQDAYGSVSLGEMVKVWPSMDKKRKSGLSDLFKRVQALRVKYTQCGTPSVNGDTATISCTQSMTNTEGGKVQPSQIYPVDISLKKTNGNWLINEIVGH